MTSRRFDQAEIVRIAAAYPEAARSTPIWERDRFFSDAQKAAWELRFGACEVAA